ncbi:MAG: YceD family protein [Hylemonella sp.]|nr:YceD family protein [Hylemonella sp.]MDH5708888.1 YceD family protein [Hylemonella sp.]
MSQEFVASRLDVKAFAKAGADLSGQESLSKYGRLMEEAGGRGADRPVQWRARGETRAGAGGLAQLWLHLQVQLSLPLICQRCMQGMDHDMALERSFRFVATEAQAEAEDEEAEEDVLALSPSFNLHELIEDELLMALPLVPRHERCPTEVTLAARDDDFDAAEAAKPNPFAVLADLKAGKPGK